MASIESEVVSTLTFELGAAAGAPQTKTHVPNAQAYEALLKGRYEQNQQTPDSFARAEAQYRRAIELDPQYANAYLALGNAEYSAYVARGSGHQTESERHNAEKAFRKSLELDPSLAGSHAMLGVVAMQYDWDWRRAERELKMAVGASSATAETFYAFFLIFHGRFSEADSHLRRMLDLDPFSSASMTALSLARNLEGRFAEAREAGERARAQFPNTLSPQIMVCLTYIEEGSAAAALPLIRHLEAKFPEGQILEAMAYAKAGQREQAIQILRSLEEKNSNAVAMQWFALGYAMLGDEPNTLKWLNRSADRREFQALNLAVHPVYAPMENSPGFVALKKRMGLDR